MAMPFKYRGFTKIWCLYRIAIFKIPIQFWVIHFALIMNIQIALYMYII